MGNCAFDDDVSENREELTAEQMYLNMKMQAGMSTAQEATSGPSNSYKYWKKPLDASKLETASMYLEELLESIEKCSQLQSVLDFKVFRNVRIMAKNLALG